MSTPERFATVILAAGQGTRMKSDLPKVLHPVAGLEMVCWPVRAALDAGAERVVVVLGHGREAVEAVLRARFGDNITCCVQEEQRGTGHAMQCGMPPLEGFNGTVVTLYGDVPLLESDAIRTLVSARGERPLALLTCTISDPTGYGRILRDGDAVVGIVEHKDATAAQREITEINPGVYAAQADFLRRALAGLRDNNAQGELYLTDIVGVAAVEGGAQGVSWPLESLLGINDRAQLAEAHVRMRRRIATRHAKEGVTVRDLDRVDIDADVTIAPDAILEPNVVLRGATHIGARAHIDVGCVLTDVEVAADATLLPYTVASESKIGEAASAGPFTHLRPGSDMGKKSKVGNFVEMKKTKLGDRSKASHLAYLGDGIVEEDVNIGAGTIFCNYDGFGKNTTILEKGVFIGSDSQLVAPVRVGAGAYVATGTTVTLDVPADALAVSRGRQSNKEGYAARLRARLQARKDAAKKNK